jgi:hypothetical protein
MSAVILAGSRKFIMTSLHEGSALFMHEHCEESLSLVDVRHVGIRLRWRKSGAFSTRAVNVTARQAIHPQGESVVFPYVV